MNHPFIPEVVTLAQAQAQFDMVIHGEGGYCPCCTRWGKINVFHLTQASHGRALLWARAKHLQHDGKWIDFREGPRWLVSVRVYSRLSYWGLLENMPNVDDPTRKHSGIWRITDKGLDFAESRILLPVDAWVFDNTVRALKGRPVRIMQCVGKFNYTAMMAQRFDEA
jgi:hypothetical protein